MRGKVLLLISVRAGRRITPAYAGKSQQHFCTGHVCGDHPRLCGEKPLLMDSNPQNMGSPPPMRGKVNIPEYNETLDRITPAYAGKRSRNGIHLTMSWDHPRLCGEKLYADNKRLEEEGSPPPMRGKDQSLRPRSQYRGITPAYAGKRHRSGASRNGIQDHPRLCGEKDNQQLTHT